MTIDLLAAYGSTTVDEKIALQFNNNKNFTCCLFEIHVPKGSRIIPLVTCSKHHHEMEVLLPRNGSYTIVKSNFTPTKNSVVIKYKQDLSHI